MLALWVLSFVSKATLTAVRALRGGTSVYNGHDAPGYIPWLLFVTPCSGLKPGPGYWNRDDDRLAVLML